MATYIASYDLNKPGKDYATLYAALERLKARRVLYSQWAVTSTSSAKEIRDYLWQYMDQNDRLLVTELAGDWAGMSLMIKLSEFAGATA